MNSYCDTCFILFKLLDSCPRSHIFTQGTFLEILFELVWLLGSLLPPIIYASLLLLTLMKRTSRITFVLVNLAIIQILNELILKRLVAESRPHGACASSYGLPSGHSAFASAFVTWLILEWVMFHEKVPFKTGRFHVALRTFAIFLSPIIPISRWFLNYHTLKQILLGTLTGFLCAIIHFTIIVALLHRCEGKFWSTKMIIFFNKMKLRDNFLIFEAVDRMGLSDLVDFESIEVSNQEHKIILPLRETIKGYFWKTQERVVEKLKIQSLKSLEESTKSGFEISGL